MQKAINYCNMVNFLGYKPVITQRFESFIDFVPFDDHDRFFLITKAAIQQNLCKNTLVDNLTPCTADKRTTSKE